MMNSIRQLSFSTTHFGILYETDNYASNSNDSFYIFTILIPITLLVLMVRIISYIRKTIQGKKQISHLGF